jgi:hypothetical protein
METLVVRKAMIGREDVHLVPAPPQLIYDGETNYLVASQVMRRIKIRQDQDSHFPAHPASLLPVL